MAHGRQKQPFGRTGVFCGQARMLQHLVLSFAVSHLTQHRDHLALAAVRQMRVSVKRPRPHLDPDEPWRGCRDLRPLNNPKLDRARLAAYRSLRQGGQISWTVGNMDAAEQLLPTQRAWLNAEQSLGRR